MKCNEIRNLVLAYLDSELDAKTSQEIETHLQSCPECAQLFEHEEEFSDRLSRVLRVGQFTPALWERVESRLRAQHRGAWVRRWKAVALGSLAALVTAGLVTGFIVSRSGTSSLDLAQAVEKDHRKFLQGTMLPEFSGALPDEIARRLEGRLDGAAFNKIPVTPGFRSEGARLCHLHGVPVAWTLGRYDNVPVSLIVFKTSELGHFPKTQERLASGESVVCARTGRFQFAVRMAGDHVVCAIARASKQTLEDLVRSVL
ncbi:MAG: zf-HC2 domain-containing protein [Verrucomicrobiales bacterium]|nr:zf-HC2 domain-containing protein [Verrucomicrobiales bacterium]